MLSGKSISLRPVMEKDLDFLYAKHIDLSNRGEYFPLGVQSEPAFRKQFQEDGFWNKKAGMLVMENNEGEIVGSIEFFETVSYLDELELSYQLFDEKHWGKGYTTQAVTLLVGYLFGRMKVNRIRLVIHPDNTGSRRVAEKCGFSFEGLARGAWFHGGQNHDVAIYSILRHEVAHAEAKN